MAAHVSPANSPMGDFDILLSDDESWAFIGTPIAGSLSEPSIAFLPSPASRSLASYGVVARSGHRYRGPSPSFSSLSMSPVPLQMVPNSSPPPPTSAPSPDLLSARSHRQPTSYPVQFTDAMASSMASSMNVTGILTDSQFTMSQSNISADTSGIMSPPSCYLIDQNYDALMPNYLSAALQAPALASEFAMIEQERAQQQPQGQQQAAKLDIPFQMQSPANVQPWNPMDIPEQHDPQMFMMDDYASPSPQGSFASISLSNSAYEQQQSHDQPLYQLQQFQIQQFLQQQRSPVRQRQQQQQPHNQQFQLQPSPAAHTSTTSKATASAGSVTKAASSKLTSGNMDKVKGTGTRIEKRRTTNSSSAAEKFQSTANGSSSNSVSSEDKFIIVTPSTISSYASSGCKHNLFEHLEAMNATQKGRKGPLADEVKEGALQVRRVGACFCCHARKVRCDADRPCKNCKRLAVSVPQVMCWRFDDFLVELFPAVLRSHFRKDEMATFVFNNIASFTHPCTVRLSSGPAFRSTLEIRGAKFFTAKSSEVLQHERLTMSGNQCHLKSHMAVPIGLDTSEASDAGASLQQEKIKKVLRVYIDSIIKEDCYVEQLTATLRQTDLPRKILTIVRDYYTRTNSPIVKQALVIYTMHYVMSHHISLTRETVLELAHTDLVPQDDMFVTPRMLNRQVKAVLDEMMQEDVDKLFKMFTRELKPKSRNSWAPCLAAFLVFCLYMEAIGLALDHFAMVHNERDIHQHRPQNLKFARSEAVKLGRAVENLPFRQFAYQFHHIYQTRQIAPAGSTTTTTSSTSDSSPSSSSSQSSSYPSTASAVKPAFNPLFDNKLLTSGDLDNPAIEMVSRLRELLSGDSWHELDFLCGDYLFDIVEPHPYPRDVSFDYTGRLCSVFLLSFEDADRIFPTSSS